MAPMIPHAMALEPVQLGDDTAANRWLCDRDGGELCHVHQGLDERDADREPLSWTVPLEEAP